MSVARTFFKPLYGTAGCSYLGRSRLYCLYIALTRVFSIIIIFFPLTKACLF